jgi:hypothetical protein
MMKASQLNQAVNLVDQLRAVHQQINLVPDIGTTFSMPDDQNKPRQHTMYTMLATMTIGVRTELLNQLHTRRVEIETELYNIGVDPNV